MSPPSRATSKTVDFVVIYLLGSSELANPAADGRSPTARFSLDDEDYRAPAGTLWAQARRFYTAVLPEDMAVKPGRDYFAHYCAINILLTVYTVPLARRKKRFIR